MADAMHTAFGDRSSRDKRYRAELHPLLMSSDVFSLTGWFKYVHIYAQLSIQIHFAIIGRLAIYEHQLQVPEAARSSVTADRVGIGDFSNTRSAPRTM